MFAEDLIGDEFKGEKGLGPCDKKKNADGSAFVDEGKINDEMLFASNATIEKTHSGESESNHYRDAAAIRHL